MYCHFWYFLDKEFRFEPSVCNRCDDTVMSLGINDLLFSIFMALIITVLFGLIKKKEIMNNSVLYDKGTL